VTTVVKLITKVPQSLLSKHLPADHCSQRYHFIHRTIHLARLLCHPRLTGYTIGLGDGVEASMGSHKGWELLESLFSSLVSWILEEYRHLLGVCRSRYHCALSLTHRNCNACREIVVQACEYWSALVYKIDLQEP
jgi:hypothetical protein